MQRDAHRKDMQGMRSSTDKQSSTTKKNTFRLETQLVPVCWQILLHAQDGVGACYDKRWCKLAFLL